MIPPSNFHWTLNAVMSYDTEYANQCMHQPINVFDNTCHITCLVEGNRITDAFSGLVFPYKKGQNVTVAFSSKSPLSLKNRSYIPLTINLTKPKMATIFSIHFIAAAAALIASMSINFRIALKDLNADHSCENVLLYLNTLQNACFMWLYLCMQVSSVSMQKQNSVMPLVLEPQIEKMLDSVS